MVFNTGAALLDAIVLAVISREKDGTYGYKITQDVRSVLEVSESTNIFIYYFSKIHYKPPICSFSLAITNALKI